MIVKRIKFLGRCNPGEERAGKHDLRARRCVCVCERLISRAQVGTYQLQPGGPRQGWCTDFLAHMVGLDLGSYIPNLPRP